MPLNVGTVFVKDVIVSARAILDDHEAAEFPDYVLMPMVNMAYQNLQERLSENGVTDLQDETELNLPIGQTIITDGVMGPSVNLPTDLYAPLKMWEKRTGSSDKYVEMEQRTDLPDWNQEQTLRVWRWFDSEIHLLGSTSAVTVKLLYEKDLSSLSSALSSIAVRGCLSALAYSVAAIAAGSRNEMGMAQRFDVKYEEEMSRILNRLTHASQRMVRRRRGYGSRRRVVYL